MFLLLLLLLLLEETGRCLLFTILLSLWSLGRGRFVPFVLASCECECVSGCGCECAVILACADNCACCNTPVVIVAAVIANGLAEAVGFVVAATPVVAPVDAFIVEFALVGISGVDGDGLIMAVGVLIV